MQRYNRYQFFMRFLAVSSFLGFSLLGVSLGYIQDQQPASTDVVSSEIEQARELARRRAVSLTSAVDPTSSDATGVEIGTQELTQTYEEAGEAIGAHRTIDGETKVVFKNPKNDSEDSTGEGVYGPVEEDRLAYEDNLVSTGDRTPSVSESKPIPSTLPLPTIGGQNYFGIYEAELLANDRFSTLDDQLANKVQLFGNYRNWNQTLASNTVSRVCEEDRIPVITWQPWNGRSAWSGGEDYPLVDIANGVYDELIADNIRGLLDVCPGYSVIRFSHEMSTPPGKVGWYPWQGTPNSYIAAWRQVVDVARSVPGSNRIAWHWNPDQGSSYADLYYPGDHYVDYVGVTINQHNLGNEWTKFAWMYDASKTTLEAYNKPILIAESATVNDLVNTTYKPVWAMEMLQYVAATPNIVGYIWFSTDASNETEQKNYRIDSPLYNVTAIKNELESDDWR